MLLLSKVTETFISVCSQPAPFSDRLWYDFMVKDINKDQEEAEEQRAGSKLKQY